MNNPWRLDDLLADLHHARKNGDLGRLAFVAYCDVRRWAREDGHTHLAEQAANLITQSPAPSLEAFLAEIDKLVSSLEALRPRKDAPTPWAPAAPAWMVSGPMVA